MGEGPVVKAIHLFFGALIFLALSVAAQAADSPPPFFKGKTVRLYIGTDAGGGHDLYPRLAACHMAKYLAGNPTMVPVNAPGAGSLTLANKLYLTLPKDGTALGTIGNTLYLDQLFGVPGIEFDASKFGWIGRFNDLPLLLISWHTTDIKTTEDVLTKPFTIGITGVGSSAYFSLGTVKRLLGAQYKFILGYGNGPATKLAMERGEVDATASAMWSTLWAQNRDWIEQKKINMLVQFAIRRDPHLPDVPMVADLAKNDDQREILELLMMPAEVGRNFLGPPDLPPGRLAELRDAFDRMVVDPEFLADAEQQKAELNVMSGQDLQNLLTRIRQMPPALIERAKQLAQAAKE